jgi:hypothetical protein
MKLSEYLARVALAVISLVSANANPLALSVATPAKDQGINEPKDGEAENDDRKNAAWCDEQLATAPSPLIAKDEVLGSAYLNTLNILSANNACSNFFGGPIAATHVLGTNRQGQERIAFLIGWDAHMGHAGRGKQRENQDVVQVI